VPKFGASKRRAQYSKSDDMEITVYSATWCPDCREAKRFLAKHNIAYKEIDVATTPGAIDEIVKRTGKQAIPQFVIDGEWVQPYRAGKGFLYEQMAKRLGVKND
jgi:mycoredoxin